jgi:predicted dehydrogenase
MNDKPQANEGRATRRDFLKTTTVVAGSALAANLTFLSNAHAAGGDKIKVGIIGCGGRGSGAAENVLNAAQNVEIVAIGDAFKFRVDGLRKRLVNTVANDQKIKDLGNTVNLPVDRCFVGVDAYQKVINSDANYIILATPPGFRPTHLEAAVAAGKNIFTEKPVASDAAGIVKVLDAYNQAKQKNLAIVAGTQRRHQLAYLETMKRIHDRAIGDITAMRCYWNQGAIWFRKRDELRRYGIEDSDLAYELHNWYHFVWTCGDHIVEQHVHNLDVCNWAIGTHPIKALGMGGRMALPRGNPDVNGNIYDHFAIDFEYPGGVHCLSMCRQISGCANQIGEALAGTQGACQVDRFQINGKSVVPRNQRGTNPYVQEHTDLIASIRNGKPLNELKQVAESTFTAILGRMSAYTGKALTWDDALASKQNLVPDKLDFKAQISVPPMAAPGRA